MSDLISRQEIDKKLIGLWDLAWGYDIPSPTVPEYVELHEAISAIMNAIKEVRREIDEQPSAEPEIIRCKYCKYSQEDKLFGGYWCMGNRVDPEHYCGYAERREDER